MYLMYCVIFVRDQIKVHFSPNRTASIRMCATTLGKPRSSRLADGGPHGGEGPLDVLVVLAYEVELPSRTLFYHLCHLHVGLSVPLTLTQARNLFCP